jgi:8-oxo-dGTP pyrophosphatase MutT (NUDIX family)
MPLSPYIRELRSRVGSARLLLPSVSAHVFDEQGRLLLVRQRDSGEWSTPGGLIEPDELPADAVVRETWEETGFLVRPVHVAGVYGGPQCIVRYPNGDETQYVIVAFRCDVVAGTAQPDHEETSAVEFFTQADAESLPLTPWLRAMLAIVFAGGSGSGFELPSWQPLQG